jgi:hypothetical protein
MIQDPKPVPFEWCTDSDIKSSSKLPEDVAKAVLVALSKYGTSRTESPLCFEVRRWPYGYYVLLHHRGQEDWTAYDFDKDGGDLTGSPTTRASTSP